MHLPKSKLVNDSFECLWLKSSSSSSISGSTICCLLSGTLKEMVIEYKWSVPSIQIHTHVLSCKCAILHHVISWTFIGFLLEVHRGLGVWYGTILFIPIIILYHWWDPIWIHENVTAEKRGLIKKLDKHGGCSINNLCFSKECIGVWTIQGKEIAQNDPAAFAG